VATLLVNTAIHFLARHGFRENSPARWYIAAKRSKVKAITNEMLRGWIHVLEHTKASIRATVAHPVRMIKRQFGNVKASYRGLAKNGALVPTLFAPSHVWMA
jgi:transposase, IS5 family